LPFRRSDAINCAMDDHTKSDPQPDPPVTPEVEREVEERLRPERYDEERKTARPAAHVLNELRSKHRRPA